MPSNPVNWGILGTSPISEVMIKAIKESSHGQLTTIGSRCKSKASALAEKYFIPQYFGSYDSLLEDPEIQAIYIGLPNHLHKEWIINCANAGKHILCEKPLVVDCQEAYEIIDVLKQNNVFCMEALMYRCHPFTTKLVEIINDKMIGEIRFINASYMANIAIQANQTKGGSILNLGCYPVSLIRLLLNNEPISLIGTGEIDSKRQQDRCAHAILNFPNDVTAMVYTSDDLGFFSQFDIFGTEGHIRVMTNPWLPNQHHNKIMVYPTDAKNPAEINVIADKSLYAYQIDVVNNCIKKGVTSANHPGISLQDSCANTNLLENWRSQIFKSENSHQLLNTVDVADIHLLP